MHSHHDDGCLCFLGKNESLVESRNRVEVPSTIREESESCQSQVSQGIMEVNDSCAHF